MKLSARNSFPGKITRLKLGPVSAEVTINIAPGVDVVSVISTTSAEELKLKVGAQVVRGRQGQQCHGRRGSRIALAGIILCSSETVTPTFHACLRFTREAISG